MFVSRIAQLASLPFMIVVSLALLFGDSCDHAVEMEFVPSYDVDLVDHMVDHGAQLVPLIDENAFAYVIPVSVAEDSKRERVSSKRNFSFSRFYYKTLPRYVRWYFNYYIVMYWIGHLFGWCAAAGALMAKQVPERYITEAGIEPPNYEMSIHHARRLDPRTHGAHYRPLHLESLPVYKPLSNTVTIYQVDSLKQVDVSSAGKYELSCSMQLYSNLLNSPIILSYDSMRKSTHDSNSGNIYFHEVNGGPSFGFSGTGTLDIMCSYTMDTTLWESHQVAFAEEHCDVGCIAGHAKYTESKVYLASRVSNEYLDLDVYPTTQLASMMPGVPLEFEDIIQLALRTRKATFNEFCREGYFDLSLDGKHASALPVFFDDEVRLLRPFGLQASWILPFYDSQWALCPNTSGVVFAALTYCFSEVPLNRDLINIENVLALYKCLLLRDSMPAVTWYNYCSHFISTKRHKKLKIDWSWTPTLRLNELMLSYLTTQSTKELKNSIGDILRRGLRKEQLGILYKRKVLYDWRILYGIIFATAVTQVDAARVSSSSEHSYFWVILCLATILTFPWNKFSSFFRWILEKFPNNRLSRLRTVFEETKRVFDVESPWISESGGGEPFIEDDDLEPVPEITVESQLADHVPLKGGLETWISENLGANIALTASLGLLANEIWAAFSANASEFESFTAIVPFFIGIYTAPRPSEGALIGRIMANYISFSLPFFRKIMKKVSQIPNVIKPVLSWSSESGTLDFSADWLLKSEELFENWEDLKNTQLGRAFTELLAFSLVAPMVKKKVDNLEETGYSGTLAEIRRTMNNESCSITGVIRSAMYVFRTFISAVKTGKLSTCLDLPSETLYTECARYSTLVQNGTYGFEAKTPEEIRFEYQKLRQILVREIVQTRGVGRKVAEERVIKVDGWLAQINNHLKDGSPKAQPFSLYLQGAPGVGKSSLIAGISPLLHHVMGWSDIEKMNTITYGDKYMSSFSSATTALLIDDAGNTLPEKRDTPVSQMAIDRVASVFSNVLKANVESKGVVLDCTMFVFWTSNSDDCGVAKETACYPSIIRRFGLMIEVKINKSMLDPVTGLPDPAKMESSNKVVPAYLSFQRYTMVQRGNSGVPVKVPIGNEMSNLDFVDFLITQCKAHFANQNRALLRKDGFKESRKCECGIPMNCCKFHHHIEEQEWAGSRPIVEDVPNTTESATYEGLTDVERARVERIGRVSWWIGYLGTLYYFRQTYIDIWKSCFPSTHEWWLQRTAWMRLHPRGSDQWVVPYYVRATRYTLSRYLVTSGVDVTAPCNFFELPQRGAIGRLKKLFDNCVSTYVSLSIYEWMLKQTPLLHWIMFTVLRSPSTCMNLSIFIVACNNVTLRQAYYSRDYYVESINAAVGAHTLGSFMIAFIWFSYAFQRYIRSRITDIDELKKVVKRRLGQTAAIVATLAVAYHFLAPALGRTLRESWKTEAGIDTVKEEKKEVVKELGPSLKFVANNTWIKPLFERGVITKTCTGMTVAEVFNILSRCLVVLEVNDNSLVHRVQALFLNSSLLLLPTHFWYTSLGLQEELVCRARFKEKSGNVYTLRLVLRRAKCFDIKDSDLSIVMPEGNGPDRPDIVNLFPLRPSKGEMALDWITFDKTFKTIVGRTVSAQSGGMIEHGLSPDAKQHLVKWAVRFHTPEPTYMGSCGSVLLSSHKGTSIAGIYVAGQKTNCKGVASAITLSDIHEAENYFREKNLYLRPTERYQAVSTIGKHMVKVVPGVHPNNPVNYQESLGVVHATVEKTFTPRAQTTPNVYEHVARPILQIKDYFKPPDFNFNKAIQPVIENAWKPISPPDALLLERAVNDYCEVLDEAISRAKAVKCADGSPALIADRFLEIDEIVNGIDGNPFYPSLNASTSAGFPYNLLKKKILEGDYGSWSLNNDDLEFYSQACSRLSENLSSGCVFSCTLKSEPRSIEKTGARAFQAVNLIGFLLVKRAIQTHLSIITHSAHLFETVLGRNAVSPEWDENMRELYGDRWLSDEDYKKFDQCQCIELRTAAARVFVKMSQKLGWDSKMLEILESTCSEFLRPLINVSGTIISTNNLMPSGTNVTAHLNGIANSIAQRVSYFKRCPQLGPFRSVVRLRNLGDDLLKSITPVYKDLWTPEMTMFDLAEFGLTLTSGTKGEQLPVWKPPGTPVGFLKRETFYNPDTRCLVGVLDPKSLLRPFTMTEKLAIEPRLHQMQICDNLVRESFFKGREEFEECQRQVFRLLDASNIPREYNKISCSYDEILEEFNTEYQIYERFPPPAHMALTVSDEYLHFTSSRFVREVESVENTESEDVLIEESWTTESGAEEATDNVKWVIGDPTQVSSENTLRLYAGEHIISLLPLLKSITDINYWDITNTTPINSPMYTRPNPSYCDAWNLIFLSFMGVRGGVLLTIHSTDTTMLAVERWGPANATNIADKGVEYIQPTVNPFTHINIPNYHCTRWLWTFDGQFMRYRNGWSLYSNSPNHVSVGISVTAGEDFSLLGYRGPPLLTTNKTDATRKLREVWYTESGPEEIANTTFAMSENVEEELPPPRSVRDPSVRELDEVLAHKWLERPILVQEIGLAVGSYSSYVLHPYLLWRSRPIIAAHLKGTGSISVDLVVRLEVSSSIQHSGLIMMSLLPMTPSSDFQGVIGGTSGDSVNMSYRSNLSHVTSRVGNGGYVDLPIPWLCSINSIPVAGQVDGTNYDPVVFIDTIAPVQTTQDSTDAVYINIFVYATRVVQTGITSWVSEGGTTDEKFSSKASVVAGNALMMADLMSTLPTLALPFEVAGSTLNGVAGAARMFGHSRPLDMNSSNVPISSSSLTCYNTNLRGTTLALDKDQGVTVDGIVIGQEAKSEMLISEIISKPFLLGTTEVDTKSKNYDIIATLNVGPQLYVTDGTRLAMGGGGLLSSFFRNWYGKMHYRFDFIVPAGTGGIIEVIYEPFGNFPTSLNIENNPSIRLNLRDKKSVEIEVNWESTFGCLGTLYDTPTQTFDTAENVVYRNSYHNGQLHIRLVAPLSIPGVSSTVTMSIVAWGWCDKDLVFWDYNPGGLKDYYIQHAGKSILDDPLLVSPADNGPFFRKGNDSNQQSVPQNVDDGLKPLNNTPATPMGNAPAGPSSVPVRAPTRAPQRAPTGQPIKSPTKGPTGRPLKAPSPAPIILPTNAPAPLCPVPTFTNSVVGLPANMFQFTGVARPDGSQTTEHISFSPQGYIYLREGTYKVTGMMSAGYNANTRFVYTTLDGIGNGIVAALGIAPGTALLPITTYAAVAHTDGNNGVTGTAYIGTPGTLNNPQGYYSVNVGYLNVTFKACIQTWYTNVYVNSAIPTPKLILFSALKYTLGSDIVTQLTPTVAYYSGDDGQGINSAEFPAGAKVWYPPFTSCVPTATYPLAIVGEGSLSIVKKDGTIVPIFTNTTVLRSYIVQVETGYTPPGFSPGCAPLFVPSSVTTKTAIQQMISLPS